MRQSSKFVAVLLAALVAAGCATAPQGTAISPGEDAAANGWDGLAKDEAPWHHYPFPGKKPTEFGYTRLDGRDAMAATAHSSASMLRRRVHIPPQELAGVRFSWKVPALIEEGDMAVRDKDDTPARVVFAFDGDRSKFSAKNAMLSELARALTGEEMPYATLMYVWSKERPPGTVIINPRTDRIRKIVVETGPHGLRQWRDYERDVRADFEKAFGEPPGSLVGIGIMTDSDNTGTDVQAWYGPVRIIKTKPAP